MTDQELARYTKTFAHTHPEYEMDEICPIPKKDLKVGHIYLGDCRNADKAVWTGKKFEYQRYKFGSTFLEYINHYEDDDGYDVFVPFVDISKFSS